MKNPNLVIDIGQTFIKFVVINNKYQVVDHIVLNNKLLIRKKIFNYDIKKLKNILIVNIKKIIKKYKIKKIIPITHGSASFFVNNNNEYLSGPHFSQKTSKSFDQSFFRLIKKNDFTHSIKLSAYHNLGKSFFYLLQNRKKLNLKKIITFPSLINYMLTGVLYLDKSYLACHSFAWNFKKKNLINYFDNFKKFFPPINNSGKKIGYLKEEYSKNKIEVFNGLHDTSGSYLLFKKNRQSKKSLIINTGTYFIISKLTTFKSHIKKGFYCNFGADNNLYICKRFGAGLIFQKYNPKMFFTKKNFNINELNTFYKKINTKAEPKLLVINKKTHKNEYLKLNYLIALKLSKEIKNFKKYENVNKIIIDGTFVKNREFIFFLKKLVKYKVLINDNSFINSLGASKFLNKKK